MNVGFFGGGEDKAISNIGPVAAWRIMEVVLGD